MATRRGSEGALHWSFNEFNSSLNMDPECLDAGINIDHQQPDQNTELKTSDVYSVNENLPKRFNNPDCFEGYR